jgi:hypothetical protein
MSFVLSKKRKGGGGTTVTESIPAWARPYIERAQQTAEAQYTAGNLGRVAGVNANLEGAFDQGSAIQSAVTAGSSNLSDQTTRLRELAETGGRDPLMEAAAFQSAKNAAGLNNEFASRGTLGSARQAVQQGAMDAEIVNAASQAAFQNKLSAESALGSNVAAATALPGQAASDLAQIGSVERDINQQQEDASWQALQRYASTVYGNPARQSATQSGGGGK